MNSHKVRQLLKKDEGFKLDFKLKLSLELESEKREFVKDVIAIVNTPGGRGYIIFGVEDRNKPGTTSDDSNRCFLYTERFYYR